MVTTTTSTVPNVQDQLVSIDVPEPNSKPNSNSTSFKKKALNIKNITKTFKKQTSKI